ANPVLPAPASIVGVRSCGVGGSPPCPLSAMVRLSGTGQCLPPAAKLCWSVNPGKVCLPPITSYQLFRATFSGVPLVNPIFTAFTSTSSTCFADINVSGGQTYFYRVCAETLSVLGTVCSDELTVNVPLSSTCLAEDPFGWCSDAQGLDRRRFVPT